MFLYECHCDSVNEVIYYYMYFIVNWIDSFVNALFFSMTLNRFIHNNDDDGNSAVNVLMFIRSFGWSVVSFVHSFIHSVIP